MNSRQIDMLRAACPFINEELRPYIMTFLSFYELNYYSRQLNKSINLNKVLSGPIINDYESLIGALKKNATGNDLKTFENMENMMQMINLLNIMNSSGGNGNDTGDLFSEIMNMASNESSSSVPIPPDMVSEAKPNASNNFIKDPVDNALNEPSFTAFTDEKCDNISPQNPAAKSPSDGFELVKMTI